MTPADFNRRRLFHEELRNQATGDQLRTNGSPGGAFDSPVELHDEDPDSEATVTGTGTIDLNTGMNEIVLTVTADDKTTKENYKFSGWLVDGKLYIVSSELSKK